MLLFLIIKLLVVVIFLVMFLRRPSVVWGVGLLTVTTAVLLDTFLGTFNREEILAELGFFFYVISGALLGGTAIWLWGLLRPILGEPAVATVIRPVPPPASSRSYTPVKVEANSGQGNAAFDRQMLYDEIRRRLGRDDILDLIFDLGLNESDVMTLHQDINQLIVNIMDLAAERGQTGALALAVERILTPIPPENLPRLEKIDVDSPPTILRHYLLAHYDLAQLDQITANLGIDGEQLGVGNKKEKVRNLLLYLYRRNRIGELINLLPTTAGVTTASHPESHAKADG